MRGCRSGVIGTSSWWSEQSARRKARAPPPARPTPSPISAASRRPVSRSWCGPISTRSTPPPGSTSSRARLCSPPPILAAAISCCRCSTCGPMSSPSRASGPTAAARQVSRSCRRAGAANCRVVSSASTRPRRRLDHRPYPDQRRAGLPRGAPGAGWLQAHAPRRLGQGAAPTGTEDRSRRRHQDPAAVAREQDGGRRLFQIWRRADESEPAARHRLVDRRAHEADRDRAGQELRRGHGQRGRSRARCRGWPRAI